MVPSTEKYSSLPMEPVKRSQRHPLLSSGGGAPPQARKAAKRGRGKTVILRPLDVEFRVSARSPQEGLLRRIRSYDLVSPPKSISKPETAQRTARILQSVRTVTLLCKCGEPRVVNCTEPLRGRTRAAAAWDVSAVNTVSQDRSQPDQSSAQRCPVFEMADIRLAANSRSTSASGIL